MDGPADVVVVGAGVVGTSVAWHLARSGARCLVVERDGVGTGATRVQRGGVRTQWTGADTIRMALESREFFRHLTATLRPSVDPAFDACGYAFVATTEATMAELRSGAERQRRLGTPTSVLEPGELAELVPGLRVDEVVGGTYNPEDGYFARPEAIAQAFADAALRLGVRLRIGTVRRLRPTPAGWTLELAGGDRLSAAHVVVAAGLATADLLRAAGADLPVSAEPRYMFLSDPRPPFLVRPLLVLQDQHFVVKHLADGRILAADLRYGVDGRRDDDACRAAIAATLHRFLSPVQRVGFPVVVEGAYDVTPDNQLVVGPVTGSPGLWVATGTNGRGMMLAPSIGRLLAQSVSSGDPRGIPPGLLPERFAGDRELVGEGQML